MGLKHQINPDAEWSLILLGQNLFTLKINEYLIPYRITKSIQTHNDNRNLILHRAGKKLYVQIITKIA